MATTPASIQDLLPESELGDIVARELAARLKSNLYEKFMQEARSACEAAAEEIAGQSEATLRVVLGDKLTGWDQIHIDWVVTTPGEKKAKKAKP